MRSRATVIALLVFGKVACKSQPDAGSVSLMDGLVGHEKRETKYDNGQKKEEYSVVKDKAGNYVKDGPYVTFHESGQKSEEGSYKADALEGHWQRWDSSGKLEGDVTYKDGKREGAFKSYVAGTLRQSGSYAKDQLSGPYKYFGFDGLSVAGQWTAGQPSGAWLVDDKAGKPRARASFKDGKLTGAVESLAEDGSARAAPVAKACAEFAGFGLETVRWADVLFQTLERHHGYPEDAGTNKYSGGRMLKLNGANLDATGVKEVTLIFDQEDLLSALSADADKDRGGSLGAKVTKQLHAEFSKQYSVVSAQMPFVGDCHGEYRGAGCSIVLDAPHLSFTMNVAMRTAAFGKQFAAAP